MFVVVCLCSVTAKCNPSFAILCRLSGSSDVGRSALETTANTDDSPCRPFFIDSMIYYVVGRENVGLCVPAFVGNNIIQTDAFISTAAAAAAAVAAAECSSDRCSGCLSSWAIHLDARPAPPGRPKSRPSGGCVRRELITLRSEAAQ